MLITNEVKVIVTSTARISLDANGIVHVLYLADSEIDVEHKKEHHAVFAEITGGIKHPFLIKAEHNVSFTREARNYGSKMEPYQPFLAFALVATTAAYAIMANFYFQFHKPKMPYKVFRNEEEAYKWLRDNFCAR
jgi:hypothetical protein